MLHIFFDAKPAGASGVVSSSPKGVFVVRLQRKKAFSGLLGTFLCESEPSLVQ
jgi:hypothetical protein